MTGQRLFFDVTNRSDASNPKARVEISAGTVDKVGDRQQGAGDILMYLSTLDRDQPQVSGLLSYPERAEFIFSGTLQDMRSLWMTTGTKQAFLKDPRFELWRV